MARILLCCLMVVSFGGVALAGGTTATLSVSNTSGLPGDTVTAVVSLEVFSDAQGFQLGVSHDGLVAPATLITPGAALAATNGGTGPDFFFENTAAANGPGVTVGAILSLAPPLESLSAGTHEIAIIDYQIEATATPGSISPLTITGNLGVPTLSVVVTVDSNSMTPSTIDGSIEVTTPAVSGVSATVVDACLCEASLGWTNEFAYDSIEILADGVLLETLPGSATSTTLSLGSTAEEFCVVGIANATAAPGVCTTASCDLPTVGAAPTAIDCSIDHETCNVTVSWTNSEVDYSAIEVFLDGASAAILPGADSSAVVTLAGTEILSTIEVVATDACGNVLAPISCMTECLPERLIRGDANGDSSIDISDVIAGLGYTFSGNPVGCLDALDANDSGGIDISDSIFMLAYIFSAAAEPLAPFPNCGVDPTEDAIDCANYTCP